MTFYKADAISIEFYRHLGLIFSGKSQHVIIHVHANNQPGFANKLRCHVADLATARAQIQNHITLLHVTGRITAAIVFFDNLVR